MKNKTDEIFTPEIQKKVYSILDKIGDKYPSLLRDLLNLEMNQTPKTYQDILDAMKKRDVHIDDIKEESCTGEGGASFEGGSGEQYTSALAFGGIGDKKKKKKKDIMEVSISNTPEKRQEQYEKYLKELKKEKSNVNRYKNIFEVYTINDFIENISKLESFRDAGEKIHDTYENISNILFKMAESYDSEKDDDNYEKFIKLSNEYQKLVDISYYVYDSTGDIISIFEKYKEKIEK